MKYSAFEQAALEASAGLKEIDAEIERLKAKKEALELLQASARQLLATEPLKIEAFPANEGNRSSLVAYEPAVEPPSFASPVPERSSSSSAQEEWSAFMRRSGSGK